MTSNPELIGRQPKNWTVRSLTLSYLMRRSTSPLVRGARRQRSCLSKHLREEGSHFRSWLRADITVHGAISAPPNLCLIEQGQRSSMSMTFMICSAQRTASAIALSFAGTFLPLLASFSNAALERQIGVSRVYAADIRRGRRPHSRHWLTLARLVHPLRDWKKA